MRVRKMREEEGGKRCKKKTKNQKNNNKKTHTVALDDLVGGLGVGRVQRRRAVGQQARLRGDVALGDGVGVRAHVGGVGDVAVFFFRFFSGFVSASGKKKKKRGEGRMEILSAPNAARRDPTKKNRSPPPPQKKKKKTTATHAKPRVARAICAAPLNLVAGVAVVTQLVMALPARSHLYAPPTP